MANVTRLLTHSLVDIYVGPDGVSFPVHEKLLSYHSPILRRHFYGKGSNGNNDSYGLPDDYVETFSQLLGWLYARTLTFPMQESDIGPLLELYLLAERLGMARLGADCVDTVREYYHAHAEYPSLRRVQYVYDQTGEDNAMREMMVGAVARFLTLGDRIPKHWDGALKRNGQLAVDIIRAIQEWHLESGSLPDVRVGSIRGFSAVEDGTTEASMSVNGDNGFSIGA